MIKIFILTVFVVGSSWEARQLQFTVHKFATEAACKTVADTITGLTLDWGSGEGDDRKNIKTYLKTACVEIEVPANTTAAPSLDAQPTSPVQDPYIPTGPDTKLHKRWNDL